MLKKMPRAEPCQLHFPTPEIREVNCQSFTAGHSIYTILSEMNSALVETCEIGQKGGGNPVLLQDSAANPEN